MKHIEEKAKEVGLKVVKSEAGDIYVEGPAENVAAFRAQFQAAEQAAIKEFNSSGLQPVEYKTLVRPEVVEKKTAGGIYIPEITHEREELAQVIATLIAVGGNAFDGWSGQVPKTGQRVYVAKYAGIRVKGVDGRQYQIISDKDISAIITKET
uniref:Putative chaperonin n=1 Tax=viral metagenome TaxID=1070528 RepID=A0A6M3J3B6_9ZZZZ